MQCLLFEIENKETKDSKNEVSTDDEKKKGDCNAAIKTSPWRVDSDTLKKFCTTSEFVDCPRLTLFMKHEEIINQSKE